MGGWAGYAVQGAASAVIPLGFLKFSRAFESEADMLGLQYMYKTGYDPTAFVDLFEKLESREKTKPGTMSKVFSTHPLTDDRVRVAQKNIQEMLPAKAEYVVATSEFEDVLTRLASLLNRRKVDIKQDRPRLRRSTPVDQNRNEDERPTLKRREQPEPPYRNGRVKIPRIGYLPSQAGFLRSTLRVVVP